MDYNQRKQTAKLFLKGFVGAITVFIVILWHFYYYSPSFILLGVLFLVWLVYNEASRKVVSFTFLFAGIVEMLLFRRIFFGFLLLLIALISHFAGVVLRGGEFLDVADKINSKFR